MSSDRKLVPFDRSRRRPDPARVQEFAATARRLLYERETSSDLVARTLRDTPRAEWPGLASRPEMQTSGALELLGEQVDTRLDREPAAALAIAELATAIADALPADAYPRIVLAQSRSHAWKDRGQALCYLSRYDDALRALDRAEAALAPFGTLAHDLAIVRFVRATVLQHRREFDLAETLLVECHRVFNDHGDEVRLAKSTLALGNLRVRRGDYRAAREVLGPLLRNGDPLLEATVRLTLGWCALHLDDYEDALAYFSDSAQTFTLLGRNLSALKASCSVGSALLRLGNLDGAIAQLESAREQFLNERLVEEAGLAGLEVVEARLLRHEIQKAKLLAAQLVTEFNDAGLNRRAIAALAYLTDAIATSKATPETARGVHDYIVALRLDPSLDFAAIN